MKTLSRRILLALCFFAFAYQVAQPAVAAAQVQPATDSVAGNMLFAMHPEFAAALRAQGFTYSIIGMQAQTSQSLGGFPILSGSVNEVTGFGEILCGGDIQYVNGALTMDLRNLLFQNTPAGETLSAQVFLNGIATGRQTIFTSPYNELYGIMGGQPFGSASFIVFDSGFQSMFLNFFQVPQLASAFNVSSIGLIVFTLTTQPI